MNKPKENKAQNRRDFIQSSSRFALALGLGGLSGLVVKNAKAGEYVWQIDPFKCTQCGRCADECVLTPSAVKCFHAFQLCGYCDLCGGYLKPGSIEMNTAAENQLCPTAAIKRSFVEEPFFEYTIDEDLCIGCAKCVEGCTSFGNGSLHLQINQDLCVNCNQCAIATKCPSDAITRVSNNEPYKVKGDFTE
jgi:electron transport complex protein RnfB